jgi:hypothetical protein
MADEKHVGSGGVEGLRGYDGLAATSTHTPIGARKGSVRAGNKIYPVL